MIKIFYTDISDFYSPDAQNKHYQSLSDKRKARVKSAKSEAFIAENFATGALERAVFERYGKDVSLLCENENSKPFFADNSLYFSISHTKEHAFIAISDENIGLDVEKLRLSLPLAKRFFTSDEVRLIENSVAPELDFTRIWVSKEAYTKLLGNSLADNISKISFADILDSYDGVFFSTQFIENNYYLAICSQSEIKNIEIEKIFF